MSKQNLELLRNNIINLIEQSFQDIPYPGDENLVIVQDECDLERQEILESFRGKHWSNLSCSFLKYHHESLYFFTDDAYRFYLPAYLRICISSYEESDNIPGSVIYSLTPPNGSDQEMVRFVSKMNDFTLIQKQVIATFLDFFEEHYSQDFPAYELDLLLSRYWNQFK